MSSELEAVCPSCQKEIPPQASVCPHCRYSFAGYADYAPPEAQPGEGGFFASLRRRFSGSGEQSVDPPATTPTAEPAPPTAPLIDAPPPLEAGTLIGGRYQVEQVYPLDTCTFYRTVIPGEAQAVYLVRESSRSPYGSQPDPDLFQHTFPHVARHREQLQEEGRTYTVLHHPGQGWRSLARVRVPLAEVAQALTWTHQLGQALSALHRAGYGEWPAGPAGREAILIDQAGEILIADLSLARPARAQTVAADGRGLASLLVYLTSGQSWHPPEPLPPETPPSVRAVCARLGGDQALDFQSLLTLLADPPAAEPVETPVVATGRAERAPRQLAGFATDVGRARDDNQDMVAVLHYTLDQSGETAPHGLYVVADGMGGHASGEKASRDAIRAALLQFLRERVVPDLRGDTRELGPEGNSTRLRQIVKRANRLVYENRVATNTDRGTTMTAALIAGTQVLVANVGDSRTYRFHPGDEPELNRITTDHSIVAGLVQAGEISEEEAYSHPDRNQIYRSLGSAPEVQVDLFQETVAAGDRLLLCSDGLWEMVRDPAIAHVLRTVDNPQHACDRLVEMANENGGEDNISIIVIDLV